MSQANGSDTAGTTRGGRWGVAAAVFISFLAFSAMRTPVPAVNEPHYLCKAKHFWDPSWCAGDFFLESAQTHYVFYTTVGLLTRWLTLAQTAWVARLAALLVLAAGWTALVRRLVPGRGAALWSAWVFLALAAVADWSKLWSVTVGPTRYSLRIIDFSGEWIIGGVEAKVFAYGLLFAAMALALDRRWRRAAIAAGLSISAHPIVGGWGLVAGAFAVMANLSHLAAPLAGRVQAPVEHSKRPASGAAKWGDVIRRAAVAVGLLVVCALPGVIPALRTLGGDPRLTVAADYIQVFYRLKHHLDPTQFPISAYVSFGGLIGGWLALRRWSARTGHEPWFAAFVTGSLVIAAAGLALGWSAPPPARIARFRLGMALMKFYPFRLADVMVPLACAVAAAGVLVRLGSTRRGALIGWGVPGMLFLASLFVPAGDANPSRLSVGQLAHWTEVCRWIDDHAPLHALFLTPRQSWAFKWYAQRPEYVAYKDCPQDAAGIVEWNRRLQFLHRWAQTHYSGGYTTQELRDLHAATGITHLVTDTLGPLPPDLLIHRDGPYRVYSLQPLIAE